MGGKNLQYDIEELYKWIDNYSLSRQKRNISRDFSDAVPLAEILKRHYPKLVQLHNYTPRNSVSQKLINWQTLNTKVLSKLEMSLSNTVMDQLSQSVPGIIEKVLFEVREKVEMKAAPEKQDVYYIDGLSASISGSVIPIRQKDSSKTMNHKVVPVDIYNKMESELEEKNEIINNLTNKIRHLESLLVIKEQRVSDLNSQLQKLSSDGVKVGATFFNKLF